MKRHFLGWAGPALPAAAAWLTGRYDFGAEGEPAARPLVALPGGRAGRRLQEILVSGAHDAVVPPEIVTVGHLPDLLRAGNERIAGPAASLMAWTSALRTRPPEALALVFPRRPEDGSLGEWTALAELLRRLHRDVAEGGLRFSRVAAACREHGAALSWSDERRWSVLAGVQEAYARRLETAGLQDRDLARIDALDGGAVHSDRDVVIVGAPELPGVVRRTLDALDDRVHILVHAPADAEHLFDRFGCVLPDAWEGRALPVEDDQVAIVDRPEDQVDEVLRFLHGLGGSRAPEEIVIGAPDPELVPLLRDRMNQAGLAVREAAGEPLDRSGPFRLLRCVAAYRSDRRFEHFAELVRHPDVIAHLARARGVEGDPGAPGAWLDALDRWYMDHLPAGLPAPDRIRSGTTGSRDRARAGTVADLVGAVDGLLDSTLGGSGERRRPSEWTLPVRLLLRAVYSHRALDDERPAVRRLRASLAALAAAMDQLGQVPGELSGDPIPPDSALGLILTLASGDRVPRLPDPDAVEVLGWLELHLDDTPVALVTGANEPRLPESVETDSFLPDALRMRLGLVDNRFRYARDAYRLSAMIHSRETVRLVAGRRSATGDPLRPSRLLLAADPGTVARRLLRHYERRADPVAAPDETDAREGAEAPERADGPAPDSSEFRSPPEPVIEATEPIETLAVTDFALILSDPYQFALRRLRDLDPADDHAREMDGRLFGTLAHDVLERFGRGERVHVADADELRDHLATLLDREAERRFGSRPHPAVRVQIEQLGARLSRFADWHAGRIRDGWQVRAVECETPPGGAPMEVDGTPIGIRARVDRVDHHPATGRWAVLDYKTSDAGPDPERTHRKGRGDARRWVDLQLPLYRWLLPRLLGPDGSPITPDVGAGMVEVGYIRLPRELEDVGDAMASWSEGEHLEALTVAEACVRFVREGRFEWDPAVGPAWPEERMDGLLGRGQLATGEADDDGWEAS